MEIKNQQSIQDKEISHYRLVQQQITDTQFSSPKGLVEYLGAIQAQDYSMAKWAIGARLKGSTEALVEKALDQGKILRTHVLRPTWHIVSSKDIRWMLKLTAPHIQTAMAAMNRKLELDHSVFSRSQAIMQEVLQGGNYLTRHELMTELNLQGINTNSLRAAHIMLQAELDGIVCNGPCRAKKFTYGLLSERAPQAKILEREDALAKLALLYFTSHGPATLQDFSWWSGLNMSQVKEAIALNDGNLTNEVIAGNTYWFAELENENPHTTDTFHCLPAFDEFIIGYKDRSASLDSAFTGSTITSNGIFKPVIVLNGQIVGLWQKTTKKDMVEIDIATFQEPGKLFKNPVHDLMEKYSQFLEKTIEVKSVKKLT